MTRTKAWFSPGSGTGISSNRKTSGPPKLWRRTAFMLTDQSARTASESGQERKEKPARESFPGGPRCYALRKTKTALFERDTSRFQILRLWQINRQDTLFDPGRDLTSVD